MGRHHKVAGRRVSFDQYVLLMDGYPALPRIWLGEDTSCNPRLFVFVPLIGTFGLAYRWGRVRTLPCPDCERLTEWVPETNDEESDEEQT